MNKKNIIKVSLDAVMTGILVLLYNSHVFSLAFHETAGLILSGLFIVHCLLNKKWIASVTAKFFRKGLPVRIRVSYVINILLLTAFVFILISGIKTSQILFPPDAENKGSVWRGIHHFSAAAAVILTGVHIGLHWNFIISMRKKISRLSSKPSRFIGIILLAAMLFFGSYNIAAGPFLSWLAEPFAGENSRSGRPKQPEEENGSASGHEETEEAGGDRNDRSSKNSEIKSEEMSMSAAAGTAAVHLSMISVFASAAYYSEKLLIRHKKKRAEKNTGETQI